jgi:hypothetical protein
MKVQLNETTDLLAFMDELSRDETVQAAVQAGVEEAVRAAALIARIVIVCTAQLDEEQMQRDAAQARQRSGRSGANVEATDPRKNRIRTRTV